MTDSLLLGIDLGAGSMKATLIRPTGEVVAEHAASVTTRSPRSGWSEQDPAEWWQAVCTVTRRVLDADGVVAGRIAALSAAALGLPVLTSRSAATPAAATNGLPLNVPL